MSSRFRRVPNFIELRVSSYLQKLLWANHSIKPAQIKNFEIVIQIRILPEAQNGM